MLRSLPTILLITLLAPAFAPTRSRADTIWVGAAGANALEYKNVKITGISEGKLLFQTAGRDSNRDLATVLRMQLDDDPAVTAAETAFATGKFDVATNSYFAALQSTAKPWLKPRLAQRLLESAQQVNRFDAAATGYVAAIMTSTNPATIVKPTLPAAGSTFISTAIKEVNNALATPGLQPAQKQALAAFLVDLQRTGGDQKGAAATAEQMLQTGAARGDANAGSAIARLKLDAAVAALQKNDFAGASAQINSNRALFVEPKDQAQALFILAEAQAGSNAVKSDTASWKDLAIAYMRVPAHFPDSAAAPKALLAVASIEQHQLSDPQTAKSLYQQIVTQYPNDPAAAAAKQQLQAAPAK